MEKKYFLISEIIELANFNFEKHHKGLLIYYRRTIHKEKVQNIVEFLIQRNLKFKKNDSYSFAKSSALYIIRDEIWYSIRENDDIQSGYKVLNIEDIVTIEDIKNDLDLVIMSYEKKNKDRRNIR